jgi:hypothetical protein
VNLGDVQGDSALRRGSTRQFRAMGFAVVVGVFGLVGVHPTEGRADATPVAPVLDLPVPPRLLWTPEEAAEPTTTTTVPVETTATNAPPPPETTTTTVPAPPTTAPPKPQPPAPGPRSALTSPEAQARVEAIADSSGWNWRAAGVRFAMGYYPQDCCHWGVYEAARSTIWIGPGAFGDQSRLRYVVLHELAHAWQYRQNRFRQFISDFAPWGFGSIAPALEASADCIATTWGALRGHYWNCPADAQALAIRRLRGDWR